MSVIITVLFIKNNYSQIRSPPYLSVVLRKGRDSLTER